MEIAITGKCNLRCLYCFHFTSAMDVPQDLPTGEWLTFFEELGRLAVLRVVLEGGEPFIRPDLPEIVEGIVKNRMRFNILSNGTLITDDMAAFLASTRRCEGVQVSIDGSRPETHDACRGQGNFDRALTKGLSNKLAVWSTHSDLRSTNLKKAQTLLSGEVLSSPPRQAERYS